MPLASQTSQSDPFYVDSSHFQLSQGRHHQGELSQEELRREELSLEDLSQHKAVRYCRELMRRPSITPEDAGCQRWLGERLAAIGFDVSHYQDQGVSNLLASFDERPAQLALAGHTDVVPPGELSRWQTPPFAATLVDGMLIGRGAVDMKSGLAVMLAAVEDHIACHGLPKANWQFIVTSDEEGEAEHGTRILVERLKAQGRLPKYCVVAEPTADKQAGDVIKIGRRGAISARLTLKGKQGHVAYPKNAVNALHMAARVMQALEALSWDEGSDDFPGTSLQVTHVDSGAFTDNIVPGSCEICFNIRYSYRYSEAGIMARIQACLDGLSLGEDAISLRWERGCQPYHTQENDGQSLIAQVEAAIFEVTASFPRLSTSGGTSDGRFLSSIQTQVIELGLPNRTIHQVNERVELAQIVRLYRIYRALLTRFHD
ncbi:succinyl-diaminopimelate desuccinylase [Shewanella halotolerans]|uniref:succinyl-diaminopimelate desuccinylase n=1 Tax=Shewanella halotolerans TaxID=2864204 RepID=UPI001C65C035|nr:succinyl-diaminopimelate desuccinylase [Shewanella halotolerans]QYJ91076.1 succinyl-diaminopimelate desuccinylase [Shewanella halotolerans]